MVSVDAKHHVYLLTAAWPVPDKPYGFCGREAPRSLTDCGMARPIHSLSSLVSFSTRSPSHPLSPSPPVLLLILFFLLVLLPSFLFLLILVLLLVPVLLSLVLSVPDKPWLVPDKSYGFCGRKAPRLLTDSSMARP